MFHWRYTDANTPGSRNAFEREIRMLNIRRAEANDVALILTFIRALAEYEHLSRSMVATEQDLLRDGFGAEPKFRCVIAEWDRAPVGFALYFYNYSTFQGRPGIFLEDLFVNPEFRGKGIGRALLSALLEKARTLPGLEQVDLTVSAQQVAAKTLYRSLGFETFGVERAALKIGDQYFDEEYMVLRLR